MAKQAYVYSGTDWVPLASEVTNLSAYQTKALAQAPYRNLVINGDMQVAQRGTSVASITTPDYRTVDRWKYAPTTQGTWTMTQENDAPTGSGFRNSTKVLCTTADASPSAADNIIFFQGIEGQNLQQLKKGTAAAEQLTVSFWIKSNVTGTYVVELEDTDNSRSVSASYTISASGTWEYKTVTFPADTTGVLDNDNNGSLYLEFWLGAGSNFTSGTLQTTWGSLTASKRAVGQTNVAAATNNYWQITGIQLEVGATATPFEFKPFAQDLAECQRYYIRYTGVVSNGPVIPPVGASLSQTLVDFNTTFPVQMRTQPTVLDYSNLHVYRISDAQVYSSGTFVTAASSGYDSKFAQIRYTHGSAIFTAGGIWSMNSSTGNSYIGFGAEL